MFRRTLTAALLLTGTVALMSCTAIDSTKAANGSSFPDRSLKLTSIQTAARTPGAGLSSTRTSASGSSKRTVIHLGQTFDAGGLALTHVHTDSLPGWRTERHGDALAAFLQSCKVLNARDGSEQASPAPLSGTVSDWQSVCAQAASLDVNNHPQARAFFENAFKAFEVEGEGTFTGYYEAEIRGSRTRSRAFNWPLYTRPPELVADQPYFTREEIERGALANRGLELLYVDNPVDVFMLQIQGSGVVRLDDGTMTRVGYAANNAHPFVSLREELERRGFDKAEYGASIQAYTRWLKEHPRQAMAVMNTNPRFIFFTENFNGGAIGAQGIELTGERSMAVDLDYMPLHVPLWLETYATAPNGSTRKIKRMMVAQDTGSAINGQVRGDFFWGSGAGALAMAGRMKSPGVYTMLLPNSIAARLPAR